MQPYSIISIINSKVIEQIKAFYGFLPEDFEKDAAGQMTGRVDTVLVRSIVGDLLIDHPMESLPSLWASKKTGLGRRPITPRTPTQIP